MNDLLDSLGEVWVYLNQYHITHGRLHVLVSDSHFVKLVDVLFSDCLSIHGPTSVGPVRVRIHEEQGLDAVLTTVFRAGVTLEVRALRVRVERTPAESSG
jgi:hypothetical protein